MIDVDGNVVIPFEYAHLSEFFDGLAVFKSDDGRYGCVDRAGNVVIPPSFDEVAAFIDGLAPVRIDGKYGYIDKSGDFAIEPRFHWGRSFHEERAVVRTQPEIYAVIDISGKLVGRDRFLDLGWYSEGLAPAMRVGDNTWGFIDRSCRSVLHAQFSKASQFSCGLARVGHDRRQWYINHQGKQQFGRDFAFAFSFFEGLASVEEESGEKQSLIDVEGKFIVRKQFVCIGRFSEGLSTVKIGRKYGYINRNAEVVIDPLYKRADVFKCSRARVRIGKHYGYIDKTGNVVIEPGYRMAGMFHDGLAPACVLV